MRPGQRFNMRKQPNVNLLEFERIGAKQLLEVCKCRVVIAIDENAIGPEKHISHRKCHALVTVDERVVDYQTLK